MKRLIALLFVLVLSLGCAFADGRSLDESIESIPTFKNFCDYISNNTFTLGRCIGQSCDSVANVADWMEQDGKYFRVAVTDSGYCTVCIQHSQNTITSIVFDVTFPDSSRAKLDYLGIMDEYGAADGYALDSKTLVSYDSFVSALSAGLNDDYIVLWNDVYSGLEKNFPQIGLAYFAEYPEAYVIQFGG